MELNRSWLALGVGLTLVACSNNDDIAVLVSETALPVLSETCPYGGIRTQSGSDANGNNALDADEVLGDTTVCNTADDEAVTVALRRVVDEAGLTMNRAAGRTLPSITEPVAQLGMQLFFTKGLSGDQDSACVTCHHPFLGGGDDLSLPVGVGAEVHDLLGPGRLHDFNAAHHDGGPTVPRNAPTTFNIALWDEVLFHDGRLESLSKLEADEGATGGIRTPDVPFGQADPVAPDNLTMAQARFPVTSPEEMRGFAYASGESTAVLRQQLQARFDGSASPVELAQNDWLAAFREGFEAPAGTADQLITFDNITRAIAAYERSQTFVDNAFRDFIDGEDHALSGTAKLGALLFYGDAGCSGCHKGDFMSDEQFHVVAMPQIGRGKGDSNGVSTDGDFGRFRETRTPADRFAFRTPSLLNVAETGPWGHAGAYTSLEAVIRHHADPAGAVSSYDFTQIDANIQTDNMVRNTQMALDQLANLRNQNLSELPVIDLDEARIGWLTDFLVALTDPCLADASCIGQWVPATTLADPDGLAVQAIDQSGDPLAP